MRVVAESTKQNTEELSEKLIKLSAQFMEEQRRMAELELERIKREEQLERLEVARVSTTLEPYHSHSRFFIDRVNFVFCLCT